MSRKSVASRQTQVPVPSAPPVFYVTGRRFNLLVYARAWAQARADEQARALDITDGPEYRAKSLEKIKPRGCECDHCGELLDVDWIKEQAEALA